MRFQETSCEEYARNVRARNLHPELAWLPRILPQPADPSRLFLFPNLLVHGPPGAGKYSQVLSWLQPYSPTNLQYEKKVPVQLNKQTYVYRVSDIHCEIDMALLGCNAKLMWHEIYCQIVDMTLSRPLKAAVVVCKNFHATHRELLEVFYSYMQQYNNTVAEISPGGDMFLRFILLSENVSFLPQPILRSCMRVAVARPSMQDIRWMKSMYETTEDNDQLNFFENLKSDMSSSPSEGRKDVPLCRAYITLTQSIIQQVKDPANLDILQLRETIYDIFTYNLDVGRCVFSILSNVFESSEDVAPKNQAKIICGLYTFFQYYNNNYRPIYHLEKLFVSLVTHEE